MRARHCRDNGVARAQAEHVILLEADQSRCPRAVLDREPGGTGTAHQHDGPPAELACRQLGSARELVRDGWNGDHELVAVGIRTSDIRLVRHDAGTTDRDVGLAESPCPSCGVADDDRDTYSRELVES